MKYSISRASQRSWSDQPCERAFKDEHGLWYIEINTLEELSAFCVEHNSQIVYDEDSICIYDSYLE